MITNNDRKDAQISVNGLSYHSDDLNHVDDECGCLRTDDGECGCLRDSARERSSSD